MLKKIGVFVAVVERGSFTAAAEALGTAQPWVSVQVRQLEQSLGVRLLEREARSIELTPEGRAILPLAQKIISAFGDLVESARSLGAIRETLRVETEFAAINDPLKNLLIAQFAKQHQDVRLVTSRGGADKMAERLVSRDIDVAYSCLPSNDERLQVLPMAAHEILLLIPLSHHLSFEEVISPEMLSGCEVLIGRRQYSTDTYDRLRRVFLPYDVHWMDPPDPGHDCRLQMTQMLETPSLWLSCLHSGPLPDDVVLRRFKGSPLVHKFGLMRVADRPSKTIDQFWSLAEGIKSSSDLEQRLRSEINQKTMAPA